MLVKKGSLFGFDSLIDSWITIQARQVIMLGETPKLLVSFYLRQGGGDSLQHFRISTSGDCSPVGRHNGKAKVTEICLDSKFFLIGGEAAPVLSL